jgi:predicted N-acyltransferase
MDESDDHPGLLERVTKNIRKEFRKNRFLAAGLSLTLPLKLSVLGAGIAHASDNDFYKFYMNHCVEYSSYLATMGAVLGGLHWSKLGDFDLFSASWQNDKVQTLAQITKGTVCGGLFLWYCIASIPYEVTKPIALSLSERVDDLKSEPLKDEIKMFGKFMQNLSVSLYR